MTRGMKKTGIDWVPFAPKGWKILRGKFLYKKMERKIDTDEVVTVFRDGQVVQRKRRRNSGFTNAIKEIGYQGVCKGDLVIHSMDAFAGAIGVSEDNGKCSPVCIVLEGENKVVDNYYFAFLLRVYSNLGYIESMSKGIRVRSTDYRYATFANTLLLVPSLNEQRRIVEIIQSQSTLIDSLISETQQSIEELKKYKQALITETVTKGLDKNAEMKDSGIDSLGEFPINWEIENAKNIFFMNKGLSITKENLQETGVPVISYGDIHSKYGFNFDPSINEVKRVSFEYLNDNPQALLKRGDFVFADTSEDIEGSGNFTCFIGNELAFAGYHTIVLKLKKEMDFQFLAYLFESRTFRQQIQKNVQGIKVYSITQKILKNQKIWVPPIEEQLLISKYLDTKRVVIEDMIEAKKKAIIELKNYKNSLIYEYVTGKKEV